MKDEIKIANTGEAIESPQKSHLIADVRNIVNNGLRKAYQDVNTTIVHTYWQVGRRIVEEEQNGDKRAGYGTRLITTLAEALSHDYSRGFTARDLRNYRQFYLCFNDLEIWYTRVPNHSAALSIYREQKYPHLKLAYYIRTPNVN